MADLIIIAIIAVIIIFVCRYIYKSKKSGQKCIGCPNSHICGKEKSCNIKTEN